MVKYPAGDALPVILKGIRKSLRLTQLELSQSSGLSRQTINYYETGRSVPSPESIDLWLKAINREIKRLRRQHKTDVKTAKKALQQTSPDVFVLE